MVSTSVNNDLINSLVLDTHMRQVTGSLMVQLRSFTNAIVLKTTSVEFRPKIKIFFGEKTTKCRLTFYSGFIMWSVAKFDCLINYSILWYNTSHRSQYMCICFLVNGISVQLRMLYFCRACNYTWVWLTTESAYERYTPSHHTYRHRFYVVEALTKRPAFP